MASEDFLVFAFYVLGMLGIGLYFAIKAKTADDMLNAGGQSPWWVAGLSGFMTMFSAGTFVVWGGLAYSQGLVAIIINLGYGIAALIVGWLVAGKWQRLGLRTPADYVELRFGIAAVRLYTWFMMVFRLIGAGVALYALAVIVAALIPLDAGNLLRDPETGNLSVAIAALIFGLVIVLYTMAGGLWAVLMTDVVQFIVLNLAVLLMVPLIVMNAGGLDQVIAKAPEGFFSLTGGDYGWYFIVGWALIHVFMIGGEWAFAQRFISVPSEKDARKSAWLFGILYLVSPFLWLAPPLIFRTIVPDAPVEQAYILAAQSVLPAGVIGLMLAAMFSATASLVSSQLNVFAGVIASPWIRRLERAGASASSSINAVRVATVVLGVGLVALAAAVPVLGGAEALIISATSLLVGPLLAPSVWGLIDRNIGFGAVLATLIFAILLGLVAKVGFAEGGVFTGIGPFMPVAEWVAANRVSVDLTIGIVAPMVVLTVASLFAREPSAGGTAIFERLSTKRKIEGTLARGSEAHGIVAVSLGSSGLVLGLIAIFSEKESLVTGVFAGLVLMIGGVSAILAKKH